jgi:poly(A) polymerase
VKLPEADWRNRRGLAELLDALGAREGLTRIVGGAVRDTLLGHEVADIDCATALPPEEVRDRVIAAGFKAVPTGIAHGTITAVIPAGPIEVTTLRHDVSTDGRRATVAFTEDWRADAARRDFTMNALSADPVTGEVYDYFGGIADLEAGRVRFIGEPLTRIAEDHLRILRFFRFHARFGRGEADAEGLAACAGRANDLMALSRERIADEILKLLAVADPTPTVGLMLAHGVFAPVIPEIDALGVVMLERLTRREQALGLAPDPLRRLAALFPADPGQAGDIAIRLKLSNAARRRLELAAARNETDGAHPEAMAYRHGADIAVDRLLIGIEEDEEALAAVAQLKGWMRPKFSISGGDLIALGLRAGPVVAATLQAVERQWIAEDFPGADRVRAIAEEKVAQALRSSR